MVAMDGPYCPWCSNTLINIPHLFWNCPISSEIWTATDNIATLIHHSSLNTQSLLSLPSPNKQCCGRLLQAAALQTIWRTYTDRAFGQNPVTSLPQILSNLTSNILALRNIDIFQHSQSPWPPSSKIASLILT